MGRWLVLAVLCATSAAYGQTDQERVETARRRLEQRQREALARAATRPAAVPATRPAKAARRVVFVVDATGSMVAKYAAAINEVGKSISGLKPDQAFGVIVVQNEKAASLNPALLPPTEENRQRAWEFLQGVKVNGPGDSVPGLQAAAKMRPDVVWLVSDGDVPDNEAMLKGAVQTARIGRFRINTTTTYADEGTAPEELLRLIAARSGGVCIGPDGKPLPLHQPTAAAEDPIPAAPPPSGPSILQE